ncbi:hypothetical protein QLQ12_20435 [Actinoplanes sp. NEAU-A12]|uniref:Uncharacterized protein n=1 Tax=Actinoplanes sandaracinus TaxID=3045177 RepID=A0ABT6WMM4_9ACTN|nr:hypothetical protein [Actinoplanes sandaracinus]MDI6100986.1 hypothetical protein [Actinoplanes sandaracinus]
MNRAEAIPVDGSRSTTEPSSGRAQAVLPPAPGEASPPQVTTPTRAAGGNDLAVRLTVRLRPPAPALPPYRGRAAVVTHRGRPDSTPDRLPVRRAGPAAFPDQRAGGLPAPWAGILPDPWAGALPDRRAGQPAEARAGSGSVTRRTGRGRGPIAARRVVGL